MPGGKQDSARVAASPAARVFVEIVEIIEYCVTVVEIIPFMKNNRLSLVFLSCKLLCVDN